jgi:tetratricopeptide (TPR) repeat protein
VCALTTTPDDGVSSAAARSHRGVLRGVAVVVFAVFVLQVFGDTPSLTFAQRAEKKYLEARERFQSKTNNDDAAAQFGQACFDWAEFARNDAQREQISNEGIAACRQLIARSPSSVSGHYYLGMNLGQLARTRTLGALKLVDEMEREFAAARILDAKFDYAGPDRNLGLLYFDAPGWPASIGSKSKAREHLQRAVVVSGDYPENRLCLLEAYLRWKETKAIQREMKAVKDLLPKAREKFAGELWEQSWLDWDKRWKVIREKSGDRDQPESSAGKPSGRARTEAGNSDKGKEAADDPVRVVKLDDHVRGKVASVNANLRFVVMDFPLRKMPALDQRLNVYRNAQKVGEVKVTGPALDTTIAGDITAGEAQLGDEVRED